MCAVILCILNITAFNACAHTYDPLCLLMSVHKAANAFNLWMSGCIEGQKLINCKHMCVDIYDIYT